MELHPPSRFSTNRYELDGDIARLIITRRDGSEHVVTFDAVDLEDVQRCLWRYRRYQRWQYAATGPEIRLLGKYLLDVPREQIVSYRNGNGMDCRRCNIYATNRSEIKAHDRQTYRTNTGQHHVSKMKDRKLFCFEAKRNGQSVRKYYPTLAEATVARDQWFALNDPFGVP